MRWNLLFSSLMLGIFALLLLRVPAATALDVDAQFLVYSEAFDDEFAYSTDPDVDLAGLEGLNGISFPSFGTGPTLDGKTAHAVIGGGAANDFVQRVLTVSQTLKPIDSLAVRGRFSNLLNPPPGTSTVVSTRAVLDPNPGFVFLSVNANLEIDEISGTAILYMTEAESDSGGTVTSNSTTVTLPNVFYTEIRNSGAAFTLDIELNRTSVPNTATSTIEIAGQAPVSIGPVALSLIGSNEFVGTQADFSLDGPSSGPAPAEVDFQSLSVYYFFTSTFDVDTTVDALDTNAGDGFCIDTNGSCSLRAAIQESNVLPGPGRINLPSGQYDLTVTGHSDDVGDEGDLDVLDGLEIRGAGRDVTVVDGVDADRVFDVPSLALNVPVRLRDLAIQNGFALANGSDTGGGLENFGRMALERCVVRNNRAGQAGGISNPRALYLNDCVVKDNAVVSLFSSPRAGGIAGPAFGGPSSNPLTRIRNSAIVNNSNSTIGGAEFVGTGSVKIENTTISGDSGVLLQFTNSNATLRHVTLVGNSQKALQIGSTGSPVTVEIANTAIEGAPACNLTTNAGVTYIYDGNNASDDAGCGFTAPGSIENASLQLGSLLPVLNSEAHVPQTGSPLIDAAGLARCPVDDQVFGPRPTPGPGGGPLDCDIGAIEVPEANALMSLLTGAALLLGIARTRRIS